MRREKIRWLMLVLLYAGSLNAQDTTGNIVAGAGKEVAGYWIVLLSFLLIMSIVLYRQVKNERKKLTITRKRRVSVEKEIEPFK